MRPPLLHPLLLHPLLLHQLLLHLLRPPKLLLLLHLLQAHPAPRSLRLLQTGPSLQLSAAQTACGQSLGQLLSGLLPPQLRCCYAPAAAALASLASCWVSPAACQVLCPLPLHHLPLLLRPLMQPLLLMNPPVPRC
jgi:hypothetical protein